MFYVSNLSLRDPASVSQVFFVIIDSEEKESHAEEITKIPSSSKLRMPTPSWTHVSDQLRKELFDTILGRGNTFSKVWLLQHIDFPSIYNECRLQIKQYYNGPCGAVASMQVVAYSGSHKSSQSASFSRNYATSRGSARTFKETSSTHTLKTSSRPGWSRLYSSVMWEKFRDIYPRRRS